MSDSESVSSSDGSNRSGWVHPMMLLAYIVTVGYILIQCMEAPPLHVGVVPASVTDTPPPFHSREKFLFFHDFET